MTNLWLPGQYDERLLSSLGVQGPYYNWNRWYLPGVGRYLEPDSIAMGDGFNGEFGPDWYGYANQNPLRYTDRRGLFEDGGDTAERWLWASRDLRYQCDAGNGAACSVVYTAYGLTGVAAIGTAWWAIAGLPWAAPALARAAPKVADTCYRLSQTVEDHAAERPYINSPLLMQLIMESEPIADPGGIPGGLRWDVLGSFNGSQGVWELVLDPASNTVFHWVFKGG